MLQSMEWAGAGLFRYSRFFCH